MSAFTVLQHHLGTVTATNATAQQSTTTTTATTTTTYQDSASGQYIFLVSASPFTINSVVTAYLHTELTNGVATASYYIVSGYKVPTNYLAPYTAQQAQPTQQGYYYNNQYYPSLDEANAAQAAYQAAHSTDNVVTDTNSNTLSDAGTITGTTQTTTTTNGTPVVTTAGTKAPLSSYLTTKNILIGLVAIGALGLIFFAGKKPIIKLHKS